MAQHSLNWSSFHGASRELGKRELGVDKASVIVGFVVGLIMGLGVVSESLTRLGAPDWLVVLGLVLTVAATTVVGMRAGDRLASRLRRR